MKKYYIHEDLLALLVEAKGDKTLAEFSRLVGNVSPSMLSNILCGHRRADGKRVLKYLGLRKVVLYESTSANGSK